jgi:hypothetical protein
MNLLVTNTRNAQAYGIIRALRPYAEKIVATRAVLDRPVNGESPRLEKRWQDRT